MDEVSSQKPPKRWDGKRGGEPMMVGEAMGEVLAKLSSPTGSTLTFLTGCTNCSGGLKEEMLPILQAASREEWADYPEAFCDCPLGRAALEMSQRWRKDVEEALARQVVIRAEHRLMVLDRRMARADIPDPLRGYTIKKFFALAGADKAARAASNAVLALIEGRAIEIGRRRYYGVLLTGPAKTGKTGVAIPLLLETLRNDKTALFLDYLHFLRSVRAGYDDSTAHALIDRAIESDVLLLDNFGRTKPLPTDHTILLLDEILGQRALYQRVTMVTTRLSADRFGEQFGDSVMGAVSDLCASFALTKVLGE